jgi:GDP-L-fucose synthase
VRRLAAESCEIIVADRRSLDLTDQKTTEKWLGENRPDAVFLAAGLVGGIFANNTFSADFISNNLAIALNVIRGAHVTGVGKLLALGSSCIYPKHAPQPMAEEALLTGPLEPTNEFYAIAKIAAIKLCEAYRRQHGADFISVMPTNLYGQNDNYHPLNSHVPPALIRRFHEAKIANSASVIVWGTGTQRREFLAVDDLAEASVFLMKYYSDGGFLNVGTGEDISMVNSQRSSPILWDFEERSSTTPPAQMAPRKNFSMYRRSRNWGGRRGFRYVRACRRLMPTS